MTYRVGYWANFFWATLALAFVWNAALLALFFDQFRALFRQLGKLPFPLEVVIPAVLLLQVGAGIINGRLSAKHAAHRFEPLLDGL